MLDNVRGALLMIASMAARVLHDSAVKLLGERLPLFQILFLRGILTVIFVAGLCQYFRAWTFTLSAQDWTVVSIRSLADIGASFLFLSALFQMPLANLTAILQFLPLTIALGAALFFNETLGWRRLSAIIFGFVGMGLIVRPSAEGFGPYLCYGVGAVFCVALRDLVTRRLNRDVPSLLVTFFNTVGILVYSSIALVDRLGASDIGGCETFIFGRGARQFCVLAQRSCNAQWRNFVCSAVPLHGPFMGFASPLCSF